MSSAVTLGVGLPALLARGLAIASNGHMVSLSSSGQNGLMDSYKYHCCLALSPRGGMSEGSSSPSGVQDSISK